MQAERIPVAWCTTGAAREAFDQGSLKHPVTWTSPEDPFGDKAVAILDTRAFGSARALLAARSGRPACLVLVLCGPEEVPELVGELYVTDDIALHETPISLLEFRLNRLVGGENAGRDSLTGLFQRMVLFESMQQAVQDPDRMPLSLLIVDLDRFKEVNDLQGHAVGDDVLKQAAVRITRAAPGGAVVARFGGDEFAVLHTMGAPDAVAVADRIRAEFKAAPMHGMEVTVSIGCATAKVPCQSLFSPADEALYTAKAKGRDCAIHYDEIARRAREENRDPALESFENRTRVIAERVAELIAQRGRKLFGELKEQADVDVLTGLFSRRYLDRRLPVELEVSTDRNMPFTVALLDIDHFGAVNKTHGFPTGDKVLNQVAARIRANTRSEDWAARYGGEEICVVMLGASIEVARPALERIRSAVAAETFRTTGGQEIAITVSGGAAERDGDESLLTLMERVSRNLLSAKQGGRNRIVT